MKAPVFVALIAIATTAIAQEDDTSEFGEFICTPRSSIGYVFDAEQQQWTPTSSDVSNEDLPTFAVRSIDAEQGASEASVALFAGDMEFPISECIQHGSIFTPVTVDCASSSGDLVFSMGKNTLVFSLYYAGTFTSGLARNNGHPEGPSITVGTCEKSET